MKFTNLNQVTSAIIDAAIEVHRQLGPGLLEIIYEICLVEELLLRGIKVSRQVPVPVIYKGKNLNRDFFIDLLIEDQVIVELKAIETVLPVHEVQLVTYLKLTDKRVGLLINFNVPLLKNGIVRRVNKFED